MASYFRDRTLVEDGCWWVPTVARGEPCSCAPAFRDAEFANALDTMVKEVKSASPNAKAMAAASGNGSNGNGSNGKPSNR